MEPFVQAVRQERARALDICGMYAICVRKARALDVCGAKFMRCTHRKGGWIFNPSIRPGRSEKEPLTFAEPNVCKGWGLPARAVSAGAEEGPLTFAGPNVLRYIFVQSLGRLARWQPPCGRRALDVCGMYAICQESKSP